MILLLPLLLTTVIVRLVTWWLSSRGYRAAAVLDGWPTAAAAGMAAVFISTGLTHFIEPQRFGLIAIVPDFVPFPALAVTITGIIEFMLVVGLIYPRARRWAALAAVLLLLALFPANVVAAAGVDHPAAPSTPLVPRAILQLIFIGFAILALLPQRRGEKSAAPFSVGRTAVGQQIAKGRL